jgi:Rhodopirellula transposase DDE domain
LQLIEPETAGDPMSEQKWVRSSLRHLCQRLKDLGHRVSPPTVARLLKKLGYSLKVFLLMEQCK